MCLECQTYFKWCHCSWILTVVPPVHMHSEKKRKMELSGFLQDFFQFASGPGVDGTLRKRAEKFKAHLTKKFNWDFEADLDDCAPVVVELPEGFTVD